MHSPARLLSGPSSPSRVATRRKPTLMQFVVILLGVVVGIGIVASFRGNIISSVTYDLPVSVGVEQHPSHIHDVHVIIDQLELHEIKDASDTGDSPPSIATLNASAASSGSALKCGDIEATRKIFSNLQVMSDQSKIHIWPLPQSYTLFQDVVSINVLSLQYESNVDHPIINKAIQRYKNIMFAHTSRRTFSQSEQERTINKLIIYVSDNGEDDSLDFGFDEHYELIIHDPAHEHSCNEIILRSHKIYGALRGLETLSQLVTYNYYTDEYETHVGIIKDFPRFQHRGMLLDTARHWHPVGTIRQFLLSLSYAKYNVFHWHIVDEESFPYESKAWPRLWNGSWSAYERYSEQDILEIIAFATELGIRVIPEFDTPGHAGSWCVGYPQLCLAVECLTKQRQIPPHLLDPSKAFTWRLIDGLWAEAAQRFPDSFFHLGSDEVPHDCFNSDAGVREWAAKQGIKGTKGVYGHFVRQTGSTARKYGKTPIVWNEVYDTLGTQLDTDIVVELWQGQERDIRQRIIDQGYRIIISYGWYLDHLKNKWQDMYLEEPMQGLHGENMSRVLGGESCMWSEKVDLSNLFATIWPKAATVSERLWSHRDVRDIKSATARLQHFRCLLIRRGIGAAPTINVMSRQEPPMQESCLRQ